MVNTMNHKIISKEEWPNVIRGLRIKFNWSQNDLCTKLRFHRHTVLRWENKQKFPYKKSIHRVINLIEERNMSIQELIDLGKTSLEGFSKDVTKSKLSLEPSEELAELIGIILGDGEIMKDGTIRISFDPKKDKNFLYRNVFPLVKNILGNKISFESDKRVAFYNIAFQRYLGRDCHLKAGNKFHNNWSIPAWCFERNEYLSAVLRGLFDTDGYFGYHSGSTELMFGRFSERSTNLVSSIKDALVRLRLSPSVAQSKDGRYKIRLHAKPQIIQFFRTVGTSNIKHIVRFLLWRKERYEAKIELEGLEFLIKKANLRTNLPLPFLWKDQKDFIDLIDEDETFLEGIKIRKSYKWNIVLSNLIDKHGSHNIAKTLNVTERSVRKWREGTRIPSPEYRIKLLKWDHKP